MVDDIVLEEVRRRPPSGDELEALLEDAQAWAHLPRSRWTIPHTSPVFEVALVFRRLLGRNVEGPHALRLVRTALTPRALRAGEQPFNGMRTEADDAA